MVEINVIIYGVILIFISTITVMIGITIFQITMPIMNEVANQSEFINATDYEADQTLIWNFAKIALFICIAVPFIYIAVRLFYKEEPTAYIEGDYE